jgi:hypothetical protein
VLVHGRVNLGSRVFPPSTASHARPNPVKIGFFLPLRSNRFRSADSGRNASLDDTSKDSAAASNPAAVGGRDEVPAKEDDATGGAAALPPVSSEESAKESGERPITRSPNNYFYPLR